MNVSQSTLSRAVQRLENEYNIQLIHRTTRSFHLTPVGEELFKQAIPIVDAFENLKIRLSNYNTSDREMIRIGFPPLLNTMLAPLFVQFSELYANPLNFVTNGSISLQDDLHNGNVDIAFIMNPPKDIPFKSYEIWSDRLAVFLPKTHPLASREKLKVTDIKDERLILLDSTYQLYHTVTAAYKKHDLRPNIFLETASWDFIVEIVALHQAITIFPMPFKDYIHKENEICCIPLDDVLSDWNIVAITSEKQVLSLSIKYLIEFLKNSFKKN